MSRFDNFLDTILAVLVVAISFASIFVGYYIGRCQSMGYAGAFLLFASGALVGACINYYFCKGQDKSQG